MQAFPKAKVVLTIRNPETWQASVKSTLCKMQDLHHDFAFNLFNKITGSWYMMDTMMRITDRPVEPMGKGRTYFFLKLKTFSKIQVSFH